MLKVFPKTTNFSRLLINFNQPPVERENNFRNECRSINFIDIIDFFAPFWDIPENLRFLPECPDHTRYSEYVRNANKYITLTDDIDECDLIVFPYEWKGQNELYDKYYQLAKQHNKKLFVIYISDSSDSLNLDPEHVIVLRTSIDTRYRLVNEYTIPAWNLDYKYYSIPLLNKTEKPTINFYGFAYNSQVRISALQSLISQQDKINCDFKVRHKFAGHLTLDERISNRQEFVNSLNSTHYVLTPRGNGNFSYRFYEVLSARRIPVLIDTFCSLPLENKIDWDKFIVRVKTEDINNIGSIILNHYNKYTNDEFIKLLNEVRDMYDTYLTPIAYYSNLKQNYL